MIMRMLERLVIAFVMVVTLPFDWLFRACSGLRRSYYAGRLPPKMDIGRCDPLSEEAGEHNIQFVSRHDIAECGLKCPRCEELSARRGDFRRVRRTRLGEAVECPQCGQILIASPDTEHGDDLVEYDKDLFHRFVRVSAKQALRDELGDDIAGDRREMSANHKRFSVEGMVGSVPPKQVPASRKISEHDEIDPTFHMLPTKGGEE